jgi:LPXTG-motif cell wall-anchored protein
LKRRALAVLPALVFTAACVFSVTAFAENVPQSVQELEQDAGSQGINSDTDSVLSIPMEGYLVPSTGTLPNIPGVTPERPRPSGPPSPAPTAAPTPTGDPSAPPPSPAPSGHPGGDAPATAKPNPDQPKTGDDAQPAFYALLGALALILLILVLWTGRGPRRRKTPEKP